MASAFASAGSLNEGDYEAYAHDPNGNRTSLRKRDGTTIGYQYDALNRMTLKVVPERSGLSTTHTRDVYYGYDLMGRTLYARFDSASGEGITYAVNAFGEKTTESSTMDGVTRSIGSGHDASGARTSLTYPDGNLVNYFRDGIGRLYYAGLNNSGYLFYPPYSADGSVPALYRLITSTVSWGRSDAVTGYSYDGIGRLSNISTGLAGSGYDSTTSFARNPASQITSSSRTNDAYAWTGAVNVDRGYTANGLNQYSAVAGIAFAYDANGNLTSDGTNLYQYDIENRLVWRMNGAGTTIAQLRYDPLGRLYEIYGSSLAPTPGYTRLLHDGDALVAEYDPGGNLLRRYVHGAAEGVDDPLVWFEGASVADSARRDLYADERGSMVAVTDANGTALAINSYDEYGIPAAGNQGRFQYTGQAWLSELGMYYYKARMYSPTLGRFMQTDPIGYEDGMNMYAYVANDPINMVDPDGQQSEEVMDRRNQAFLTAMEECDGGCLEMYADAASIPLSFYGGTGLARGAVALGRLALAGRVASSSFNRAYHLGNKLSGGLTRTGGSRGQKTWQGAVAGGRDAAAKLFNSLTRGKSTARDGGRIGNLRDGSTVQTSTRTLKDGTVRTDVRISRDVTPTGSRIKQTEHVKLRFDEKPE